MVWVAAAIVFVVLLVRFTRFTIWAIVVVIAIGALGVALMVATDSARQAARKKEISKVLLRADVNSAACKPEYPMHVSFSNGNDFAIDEVSFRIYAHQFGHSNSLYSDYLTSDRVLKPGDEYGACWALNTYSAPNGLISGMKPADLEWAAEVSYVTRSKAP
ncbi:hypothetical protein [Rhizobium laguerreae]|uniref:hypothetical protein n=1 Tax=Rhizobium laguerreae TaxID=1076926 RepID=UPI001C9105C2|nr:hypothetical protein [Rhizobium laguerreae]MBY3344895.1 hypothetical protein [Rhizobium laguerreae]MBY3351929.1 hypothetical protein [Rhizobium laguerreae]MBY3372602.1 hypothetical protein [Rhizobium laguerreae]MBY3427769.1 hypothetical protein [Rhizobium laguerreae]MBY3436779.1 hypothetical protein [Rhizobium laguerreae]